MLDRDNPVQGVAVYLEYKSDYGRLQYLITPHGFTEDGALLRPYALHRFLSSVAERPRWKREILGLEPNPQSTPDEITYEAMTNTYLKKLGDRIRYGSWDLVGRPLFVEISRKDLTALRKGKTPTMLMSRLEKVKAASEFPTVKEED